MTKTPLLLLVLASACGDVSVEDTMAAEVAALDGCSKPALGTGSVCASESGTLTFQVTLASGQQYVELFARQNGVQNLAQNIAASGVANGNGTTTYSLSRPGYAANDVVTYRFYSYLGNAAGKFTPGPAEQVWYGAATTSNLPVVKDAAVIYSSYGSGPVPNNNFGGAASVDIGEYHLTSEGLFAYSLAGIPAGATVQKAAIVVPAAYAPGGPLVNLRLSRVTAAWSESTVTWNNKPAASYLRDVQVTSGVVSSIDVTAEVAAALASGEISFNLAPSTQSTTDNVFIDSKEKVGGAPTFLSVQWSN